MCWYSAANLDRLCSFYCFEITDGQCTHQSTLRNSCLVSLFADANVPYLREAHHKIGPQVNLKNRDRDFK